jgi:polysaccharide export outer membrane protein
MRPGLTTPAHWGFLRIGLPRRLATVEQMNRLILLPILAAVWIGGCSWLPRAGPSTSDVLEQSQTGGEIAFDVVQVDDRVVDTLRAQPKESFAVRFQNDAPPSEIKIAAGDTVSVLIWESADGGLFSEAPSVPSFTGGRPGVEPLAPESQRPSAGQLPGEFGTPRPPTETGPRPQPQGPRAGNAPQEPFSLETAAAGARRAAVIPEQQVGADGAISVPYAGRVPAAGRLPQEVQQAIEARLAEKALGPQALVIVRKSAANAVTVTGEVVAGDRVSLSPGGDRLLQVIAAAGGAKAPVHETFVRLSRHGVTATIPLQQLVGNPAEDIYAQPGDVLTLVRVPQTFSVFGATGRNAEIPFDARNITLGEALAKSQGLRDDLAKPEGVFLFRYEPNSVVRALDQPVAGAASGGLSPLVYRFDLRDGKTYALAQEFPVHDKDVIFVADAPAAQVYKFFTALNQVTGPILTGLLVCRSAKC